MKLNNRHRNCLSSAKNFSDIETWKNDKPRSYAAAESNGWLSECTSHMLATDDDWTLEECAKRADKFDLKADWRLGDPLSYNVSRRKRFLHHIDESVFIRKMTERCHASALKHNNKSEWEAADPELYTLAYKNGLFKKCTLHMSDSCIKWTLDMCLASAKRYTSQAQWRREDPRALSAAHRIKVIDLCTEHMGSKTRITIKECEHSARKFKTESEWEQGDPVIFRFAKKHNILDRCTTHMKVVKSMRDLCIESALKFNKKSEWALKDKDMYRYAQRNGVVRLCTAHMISECDADLKFVQPKRKPRKVDVNSKDYCLSQARRFESASQWFLLNPAAFVAASNNNWMDECIGSFN